MKQPSEEDKEKNVAIVMKMVEKFPEPRRTRVKEMLDSQVGLSYFTAPASSRDEYHYAFPGGLVAHSLNVVANLKKLCDSLCPGKYDSVTIMFVGLFHDLGKTGDGSEEAYIPNRSQWKRDNGSPYEMNKDCVYMPSSERSLYLLQKNGVELDSDEYVAIRLNDGQYVKENEPYRLKEPELALITHWADMWSLRQEKL